MNGFFSSFHKKSEKERDKAGKGVVTTLFLKRD
jgi:hypothetical protein